MNFTYQSDSMFFLFCNLDYIFILITSVELIALNQQGEGKMKTKTFLSIGALLFIFSIFSYSAPDLRFTSQILMKPTFPTMGHSLTFTVSFRPDQGPVTNLKVIGGVDGNQLYEHIFTSVPSSGDTKASFSWIAMATESDCCSTVWFELDPDHTTGDSNYNNNRIEKVVDVPYATWSDFLFISDIRQSPLNITVGNNVTFSATLKIDGSLPAINLRVTGGVGNDTFLDQTFPRLEYQETRQISFNWTATGGTKTVWFHIDPDEIQGDLPISNNRIEKTITVAGGKPDLKIEVQSYPVPNDENKIKFYILGKNIGNAMSVPFKMQVKKGMTVIHTINCPAREVGYGCSEFYTMEKICGTMISFMVDADNANDESNENNNAYVTTFSCVPESLDYWKNLNLPVFQPINLPKACANCLPWHDSAQRGDPVGLLNGIGNKLGRGMSFENVRGEWMKFLNKNNGLTPNGALKIIFNRAVEVAKRNLKNEPEIKQFQTNLNNSLNQMFQLANETLAKR